MKYSEKKILFTYRKYIRIVLLFMLLSSMLSSNISFAGSTHPPYSPPPPSKEELENQHRMQEERFAHETEMQKRKEAHERVIQRTRLDDENKKLLIIVVSSAIVLLSIIFVIFSIIKRLREGKEQMQQNEHYHQLRISTLEVLKDPGVSEKNKQELLSFINKETPRINTIEYIDSEQEE